jgi:hypothetical protein
MFRLANRRMLVGAPIAWRPREEQPEEKTIEVLIKH